jgi:DNA-binding Xre family transcriptional regulator
MMSRVREVDYRWHLRQLMANRGLFSTTDLAPLLAERGIELSAAQVYRLVTGTPERLNLHVLAALCDALGCSPTDLVEPVVVTGAKQIRRTAGGRGAGSTGTDTKATRPTRAKIVPDR